MIGNICVFIAIQVFIRGRLRVRSMLTGRYGNCIGERVDGKPGDECVRALPK